MYRLNISKLRQNCTGISETRYETIEDLLEDLKENNILTQDKAKEEKQC